MLNPSPCKMLNASVVGTSDIKVKISFKYIITSFTQVNVRLSEQINQWWRTAWLAGRKKKNEYLHTGMECNQIGVV